MMVSVMFIFMMEIHINGFLLDFDFIGVIL
jgi:hypothetical protein